MAAVEQQGGLDAEEPGHPPGLLVEGVGAREYRFNAARKCSSAESWVDISDRYPHSTARGANRGHRTASSPARSPASTTPSPPGSFRAVMHGPS